MEKSRCGITVKKGIIAKKEQLIQRWANIKMSVYKEEAGT
jgi:hypothetical protein